MCQENALGHVLVISQSDKVSAVHSFGVSPTGQKGTDNNHLGT
jgi:hypothetical protein